MQDLADLLDHDAVRPVRSRRMHSDVGTVDNHRDFVCTDTFTTAHKVPVAAHR
jgi:hypothetical protein